MITKEQRKQIREMIFNTPNMVAVELAEKISLMSDEKVLEVLAAWKADKIAACEAQKEALDKQIEELTEKEVIINEDSGQA